MADTKPTGMPVVLISDAQGDNVKEMLREYFTVVEATEARDQPHLLQQVQGVYTSGGRVECSFMKEFLPQLTSLKALATFSVGLDHLDLRDLARRGVMVGCLRDVVAKVTADMAFSLMLSHARNVVQGVAISRALPQCSASLLGKDVYESTLGIVGMGRIGLQVARRARGFDMDILYHNRNRRSVGDEELSGASYVPSLHELLPRCDFVVISCPHTPQTTKLFSTEQFNLMKTDSVLINIARGPIVDTDALVDALKNQSIGGAALDVTDPEPLPPDHELLRDQRVLVVPHWGSATRSTRHKMLRETVDNLKAVLLDGGRPITEAK